MALDLICPSCKNSLPSLEYATFRWEKCPVCGRELSVELFLVSPPRASSGFRRGRRWIERIRRWHYWISFHSAIGWVLAILGAMTLAIAGLALFG